MNEDGDRQRHLPLQWREKDGPPVTAPGRKGFGTRLIDRSSRFELNGSAELKFDPDGFNAEIEFPID